MEYKRIYQLILAFDLLVLLFLMVLSLRFLITQLNKIRTVDPQILVQYEVGIDKAKFLDLIKELQP